MWNKRNHKTRGGCLAWKQNESADPGGENRHRSSYWKILQRPRHQSCNKPREVKPDRKSSGAFTSEVTSVAGPLQTTPKRKNKGTPPDGEGHGTKWGKIDPAQERELPQERTDLSPWKWGLHLPNWENRDEHKNEKPGSTFKMPSRTVTNTNQTMQCSGINKTPTKNL